MPPRKYDPCAPSPLLSPRTEISGRKPATDQTLSQIIDRHFVRIGFLRFWFLMFFSLPVVTRLNDSIQAVFAETALSSLAFSPVFLPLRWCPYRRKFLVGLRQQNPATHARHRW